MKRHEAGTIVEPGLYVSARPWSVKTVSRGPGLLEGPRGAPYVRIPMLAIPFVGVLALVIGGVWVVTFPIVGAAMIVVSGVHRACRAIARSATNREEARRLPRY